MSVAHKKRQRIIDSYLAETGRNLFVPAEFVDWLATQPDHEAYPVFFSQSDTDAARAHRIQMVRQWVSGLRIRVQVEEVQQHAVTVRVVELPAYTSPEATRYRGGGYRGTDSQDPDNRADLVSQAINDLRKWHKRWAGVLVMAGHDLSAIEALTNDAGKQLEAA